MYVSAYLLTFPLRISRSQYADVFEVFTKLSNGPMRVIPHSEVFFCLLENIPPLILWCLASYFYYYSDFPMRDKSSEVVADEWAVVTKYPLL